MDLWEPEYHLRSDKTHSLDPERRDVDSVDTVPAGIMLKDTFP
jgi:hypothetical protein